MATPMTTATPKIFREVDPQGWAQILGWLASHIAAPGPRD
jgi:hypothetical protein